MSDSGVFTSEDPLSVLQKETEEIELLLATLQPTSGPRNHTEETLLPSTSRPALFPTSDTRNQTEATALLPSTSRSSLSPILTRNHGVSPAVSDEEAVSGADEDLDGLSSIKIEDRELREAIQAWDVDSVNRLLAAGAPLTHVSDDTIVDDFSANRRPTTTPLHMCVEKYWMGEEEGYVRPQEYQIKKLKIIKAMVEAAKKSSVLDCPDRYGRPPLFMAISSGNFHATEALARAGATLNQYRGGETPLHVAVLFRQPKILRYFLDNHEPNSVDEAGHAPMHFAAITGELKSAKLLFEKFKGEQMYLRNCVGETPWHKIASCNSMAIAQYLFQKEYGWDVNVLDNEGLTPLHIATSKGYVPMTTLLLRNGATLSVKGEKESAIKCISSNFNNSLNFFEDLFDKCVNDNETYMCVNYRVLFGSKDMSQIRVLEDFVRYGQSKILKHPTIESLIYFKWRCLLPVFYTIIVTYMTFLLSLNIFVITTFYNIDTSNVTCDTKVQFNATEALFNATEMPFNATEVLFNATKMALDATKEMLNATEVQFNATETTCVDVCGWWHWTLVVFIYISTGLLITLECIWIYLQKLHHFRRPETWLKWVVHKIWMYLQKLRHFRRPLTCLKLVVLAIWMYQQKLRHFCFSETCLKKVVLVLALAVPAFLGCSPARDSLTWQRHVACLAVLLAWLQAMLLLSRFPGWGYYVLMFERVAINIFKILAATIFLVFGFSTCLMIQYQSKAPFDGPVAAFTKTLVMMASEFDYEDLFGEDHEAELKNTKKFVRFLFVVFVVFIAIVLMNFMTGVAVSDVEELNDIGNIRRLEKQVQLLSTLEGLGDTVLAKWWRRLPLIRFHSSVVRSSSAPVRLWSCEDLRDPTQYKQQILIRFDKNCFRETFSSELHNAILNIAKKKKQNVDKLDAVYDAVVGMSHQKLDSVSIASSSPITTSNDRMKSLEDKMDRILEILQSKASNVNPKDRAKVVSHKLSQKRKNVRKKSNRLLAQ